VVVTVHASGIEDFCGPCLAHKDSFTFMFGTTFFVLKASAFHLLNVAYGTAYGTVRLGDSSVQRLCSGLSFQTVHLFLSRCVSGEDQTQDPLLLLAWHRCKEAVLCNLPNISLFAFLRVR
jgi:hypothetical protein